MNTLHKLPNKQIWNIWTPYKNDKSNLIGDVSWYSTKEKWVVDVYNTHLGDGIWEEFDNQDEAFLRAKEFTYV